MFCSIRSNFLIWSCSLALKYVSATKILILMLLSVNSEIVAKSVMLGILLSISVILAFTSVF